MIDLTPEELALLDAIASTEATGYNVMYGHKWSGEDRTFSDYSDHPRKFWTIESGPNKGQRSSAAGRYQFLGSTWDEAKKLSGVTDFTPQSQDRAAIALARDRYSRKTGRNLTSDLASNDPLTISQVARALSSTWTSLPSGIEQGQDDLTFVNKIMGASGRPSNTAISQQMYAASQAGTSMSDSLASTEGASDTVKPETPETINVDGATYARSPVEAIPAMIPINLSQLMFKTSYGG